MSSGSSSVAERLAGVRSGLPGHVTLVAVSKTQPASAIREAYAAGQRDFGENYAQEWREKAAELADLSGLCWHFIGGLQTNKVKYLLPRVAGPRIAWVHTVDWVSLAGELSRRVAGGGESARVLIEVNVAGEPGKSGCAPGAVAGFAAEVARLPGLDLRGLMCIPPAEGDPRPWFAALRTLRDDLRGAAPALPLPDLSMGMSGDYRVAVEEGATLVRVGTALFGARPPHPDR